jgi:ABC-type dipeptide/oligopeptide/nickel transport system permease subunit
MIIKKASAALPNGSQWADVPSRFSKGLRRLARNRLAVLGAVIVFLLLAAALFSPLVSSADPVLMNLEAVLRAPDGSHPFGTDSFGRDVFGRVVYGSRVSLMVGLFSTAIALAAGIPIGLLAGYAGGATDNILMRFMDALLSVPALLLAIAVMGTLGPDIQNVMLALGLVNAPTLARLVRGSVLSVKEEVYVTAARSLGASSPRIVLYHILPNVVAPIVVQTTFLFSRAILAEATLSFLGLGTQPPTPSWGQDLNEGRRYIEQAYWVVVAPALAITVSVLGINFLGDGLRDALDPRSRAG